MRDSAHRFARDVVRPVARHYDQSSELPVRELRQAFDAGLLGLAIPAEYGGPGIDLVSASLVVEELAWGCAGFAATWPADVLATVPLVLFGTEEQKRRFLLPRAENFGICSFALSEPGGGSDIAGMRTAARRDGDHYVLNGSKQWTTNAGHADYLIVFATLDQTQRQRGITAFIVPRATSGLKIGPAEDKLGLRCSDTRAVYFNDCRVSTANLLGRERQGFHIARTATRWARPIISAMATGISRAAMEYAAAYALERKASGVPIANHQAVQCILADMARDVATSRLLTWYAASAVERSHDAERAAAIAKYSATDAAVRVTLDAVQIFGGYGICRDFPVEKLLRDAKVLEIVEGTNQILRQVVATELITATIRDS